MKDIYYYQPSKPGELSSALAKIFDDMSGDGQRYIKSATVNTLLVAEAGYDKKEVEDLIDTLTMVHPNRAFLIVLDEAAKDIQAEFSTRCQKISKTEHICSEVIRLIAPSSKFAEIKSIVRGNLITGMPTELVLYFKKDALQIFKNLESISDQTVLTSSVFEGAFSSMHYLIESRQQIVDLEWVKLGLWRDQVKDAFQHAAAREKISELKKVEINFREGMSSACLFAGWIADRLGLNLKSKAGSVFKFVNKDSKEITIELIGNPGLRNAGINKLNFLFENTAEYIKVRSEDQLYTEINFKELLKSTRPIEELNFIELLKRYFFIGESTINYKDSLAMALKLNQ